jgi:hypothetical protein|tara:strand:- start:576 stop:770 length:195 start_codon:yes stop_codon:yes gene_type:complete
MRGVKDGETGKKEQAMPDEDKKDNTIENIVNVNKDVLRFEEHGDEEYEEHLRKFFKGDKNDKES